MWRVGLGVVLAPLGDGHFFDTDRRFRTSSCASGSHPITDPDMAHIAFRDDIPLRVKLRYTVGTIPGAVLASDALFRHVFHNTRRFVFHIGVRRTAGKAGGIQTVVASHRKMKTLRVGINAPFDFTDAAPVHRGRIVVLLITSHYTTLTADTTRHVKMKPVLLTFF